MGELYKSNAKQLNIGNPIVKCAECGESDAYAIAPMHNNQKMVAFITYCDNCMATHCYWLDNPQNHQFVCDGYAIYLKTTDGHVKWVEWDDMVDMWMYDEEIQFDAPNGVNM